MKPILLTAILALAVSFSACNKDNSVTAPTTAGASQNTFLKSADQLNLSVTQLAFMDEMVYLNEDLGTLLTPAQISALNSAIADVTPNVRGCDGSIKNGARKSPLQLNQKSPIMEHSLSLPTVILVLQQPKIHSFHEVLKLFIFQPYRLSQQ